MIRGMAASIAKPAVDSRQGIILLLVVRGLSVRLRSVMGGSASHPVSVGIGVAQPPCHASAAFCYDDGWRTSWCQRQPPALSIVLRSVKLMGASRRAQVALQLAIDFWLERKAG